MRDTAPGLTPRAVLDKFKSIQMLDVFLPTTDGRQVVLTRYTEPDPDVGLLLNQMHLDLPPQPPPRISAKPASPEKVPVVETFQKKAPNSKQLGF